MHAGRGKSTLNRLELSKLEPTRYHKISHNPTAIKSLLVDLFLEAHERASRQIILDLDATDDPLHGEQEGRFFHGYYDCYCYLPLYVFCGRHLLVAKLRSAAMDAAAGAVEEVGASWRKFAGSGHACAFCCAPTLASRARPDVLVRGQRRRLSCSELAKTSGSSPRSRPSLMWSPPRADAPAGWSALQELHVDDAPDWSGRRRIRPRPSGRRERPIPVSW